MVLFTITLILYLLNGIKFLFTAQLNSVIASNILKLHVLSCYAETKKVKQLHVD